MVKSNFSRTIDDLLKSLDGKEEDCKKKKAAIEDDEDIEEEKDIEESDDMEEETDDEEVEKSFDDDYVDVTSIMKDMGEAMDELREENENLKKSLEEVQENLVQVTKSFSSYLKTPNERQTVMQKSISGNTENISTGKRPSTRDFDILKSCLVKASKDGKVGLDEVQFYNSEFQKSMKGQKVDPSVMDRIFDIVREYR